MLQLVADGLANREIAESLRVSPSTVRVHLDTILRKLAARDRAHAVTIATRSGILARSAPHPPAADRHDNNAEADPETDIEDVAVAKDLRDRLAELLSALPPRQREIVVLRVVIGLSAQETADALGTTPSAVRVAQHRALAKLHKQLADDD